MGRSGQAAPGRDCAHRSLRAANVIVNRDMLPWLTDFSFAELAATQRQKDLDLAELLASLATLADADRAVSSAAAVVDRPAGARSAATATAGPVGRHPARRRPRRRPARGNQIRRHRGQRAEQAAAGPPPAGPAPYPAGHRRHGRRVLFHPAPARAGEQQLAGPAVRAVGLAPRHHRCVGPDLPGQRGSADRRRARPGTVLARHPDPGHLIVRQPSLPRQRRRHGTPVFFFFFFLTVCSVRPDNYVEHEAAAITTPAFVGHPLS